jgi:hypothetical protein
LNVWRTNVKSIFIDFLLRPDFFYIFVMALLNEPKTYTMNKVTFRQLTAVIASLIIISPVSFAQIDNVDFLRAGAADATKIMQAYFSPWANAFGAGMNGSWYNTAKPHKLGGFDITAAVNVGFVPESAGTFDVGKLGLTTLSGTGTAPTISGAETEGPTLTKTVSGVTLASFALPPGTDWKLIPVPTAQLGIGLPLGTELKVRFIPKINIKDGDLSLWGVGIMHSIMQYIPGNKLLPFDVSVFGGYTKLMANVPLSLQPEPETPSNYVTYSTPGSFENQIMATTLEAWNVSIIGSFNIPVVTFYGGLGYSKTQTEIILKGNYPTPVYVASPVPPHAEYNDSGVLSGNELPTIEIKNFSGVRANVGVRFKFAVVTIHADYTRSQYNVLSAGLGISFR